MARKRPRQPSLSSTVAIANEAIEALKLEKKQAHEELKDLLHTVNIKDVSQADMRDRLVKQAAKLASAARNAHRMEKLYTMKVEDLTKANVQLGRANASLKRVEFKFKRTLTEVLSYQVRDDALKRRKQARVSVE
ncbi:uncharacterized protein RAG0_11541 [Rhynchosporium agropyri]|uniref:Uncharacterized protein n=1 Tax=Rhynchosporium agropyri TaxID=914238 RepID=A0A1E1L4Q2_9HELO|nr:uncharacterized protein RAG0_11541 [Rhynchosporium agropyri]